jgi:predicted lipoprotein
LRWAAAALGVAAACYAFPPIRIVRLNGNADADRRPGGIPGDVRPAQGPAFAQKLWDEQLMKAAAQKAVDAAALVAEIRRDPKAAKDKHARTVGIGGSYYYFLSGTGRVVKKDGLGVSLVVTGEGNEPEVVLQSGNIFGNAVRDGSGLVNVNDYPNSQELNALSGELNKLVEDRVLPALRDKAAVGSQVKFAGVAEVTDEDLDLRPLSVVPVVAEVR